MLTPSPDKAAPRGRCPECHATGPVVGDLRGGTPRPVVFSCTCQYPPTPEPLETPAR